MFELMGYAVIGCTCVVGGLLLYEKRKQARIKNKANEAFWEKESHANTVRRKDITFLPYLKVPVETLPMEVASEDEEVSEYIGIVRTLSEKRILNLNTLTNTELKERYGVANLPELTEYDDNYTTLINTLARWGARLMALEEPVAAVTVLEYAISIGSDVSRNYYYLADWYRSLGKVEEIDRLIEEANQLDSIMKEPILAKLQEIRSYLD